MKNASFFQRVIAKVIDLIIIGVISAFLNPILGGVFSGKFYDFSNRTAGLLPSGMGNTITGGFVLVFIVLFFGIYFPVWEYRGKRIGKNLVGIHTEKLGGKGLSLIRAYVKSLLQFATITVLYLIIMFNSNSFEAFVIVFIAYLLISNFGLIFGNSETNFQDRMSGSWVVKSKS